MCAAAKSADRGLAHKVSKKKSFEKKQGRLVLALLAYPLSTVLHACCVDWECGFAGYISLFLKDTDSYLCEIK